MSEQVWDKSRVQAADRKFNEVLARVRGEKLQAELLAAFEIAVREAAA